MSAIFNPYQEWLGLEPQPGPVDHYQLLGVPRFTADMELIRRAADSRMALVRTFQTGPRGAYTQKLLNELSAARICLLNEVSKSNYDAALAQRLTVPPLAPPAPAIPPAPPVQVVAHALPVQEIVASPARRRFPLVLASALGGLGIGLCVVVAVALPRWRPPILSPEAPLAAPPVASEKAPAPAPRTSGHRAPLSGPTLVAQEGNGEFLLVPATAEIHGTSAGLEVRAATSLIAGWTSLDDEVAWHCNVIRAGPFHAEVTFSAQHAGEYELQFGEATHTRLIQPSPDPNVFRVDTFNVSLPRPGPHTLLVRGRKKTGPELFLLRSVRLVPAP